MHLQVLSNTMFLHQIKRVVRASSGRRQTCKDFEAALCQAVEIGQQLGVAGVVAIAQARARRIIPAAAHHRGHVSPGPAHVALTSAMHALDRRQRVCIARAEVMQQCHGLAVQTE